MNEERGSVSFLATDWPGLRVFEPINWSRASDYFLRIAAF